MNESDVKNAELAVCITLNTSIENLRPGRLKNLLGKLSSEAKKEIHKIKECTPASLKEVKIALDKFAELTGWCTKQKHIQTYVAAIALIIEKRNYTKINKILVDINDYQARHKDIAPGCYWSAEIVAEKWKQAFYPEPELKIDYAAIDSRMQKKEEKKAFAISQGFEFWSEMIEKLHVEDVMSVTDIRNTVINNGYSEHISNEAINGALKNMGVLRKRDGKGKKRLKTKVKLVKSKKKLVKACHGCGAREVADVNVILCIPCTILNQKKAQGYEFI